MRPGESELRLFPAADAELVDPAVTRQLVAPPHHAGVAQPGTQVIVPQVRVGVEMNDMQIRVFLRRGGGHGVKLPADY